jgi:stearoyl-CoA desaturase (Delta-9 desaturase)
MSLTADDSTAPFFWAGLVRIAFAHHVTWSVNPVCHMIGDRQLLAAGHPQHGRGLAQPAPRRPETGPARRTPGPDRHLRWVSEKLGRAYDVQWPTPERLARISR